MADGQSGRFCRGVGVSKASLNHVSASEVGEKARSGAIWSVLQIVGRNVLSIGVTAVLARLLTPDDYGLMGMVATLTALLLVFSDMGLSWATIQQKELTAAQVSNLFWINAATGLLLWLGCIIVAPAVAAFYSRPELNAVTAVMGGSFLLGGLAVQPFALMRRRMDFRRVAIIELAAVMASAVAAVMAALAGLGFWALVVQALVGQGARLVGCLPGTGIRLQAPKRGVGTRGMVVFGGLLALNGLLIYAARNLDSVFIGKVWGAESLGYYSRAYFLMLLPSTLATGVLANLMVPALSAMQDDPARFGDAYRRAVRLVAFVGCPLAAGLALTADEAVRLVYGPKWAPVAPMLLWLSIAGITQPIYNTTGWLFTAKARGGMYFALTAVNAVALSVAFWLGVQDGALGVAKAYGITMGILLVWPALALAHRAAGLQIARTGQTLLPVARCLSAMVVGVLIVWVGCSLSGVSWQWILAIKVASGVVVYLLAAQRWARPIMLDDVVPLLPGGAARRIGEWMSK